MGGELKATFCLTKSDHAFMSQHIGDMENLETLNAFERAVDHFQAIFRVEPQIVRLRQASRLPVDPLGARARR